jgi:putative NADH-flavin reductase
LSIIRELLVDVKIVQVDMKIAIFGATGKVGRHLVDQALQRGDEVTVFVRDTSKLTTQRQERLKVVQGDVLDPKDVEQAAVGTDAVLSTIGHTKTSSKDVLTEGIKNIVAAMNKHGVRRLISLTGAGVRDPKDEPKLVDRIIGSLLELVQRDLLEDSIGQALVIKESDLEWVIVRAPVLNEGEKKGEYRIGYVGKESGTRLSRADVADFMLKQTTDDTYLHQAPVISY